MEQQHVMVLKGLPQILGADQVARNLRRPIVDFQVVEPAPVHQFHQRRRLQRTIDLVHRLVAEFQPIGQPRPQPRIGIGRNRQPHRRSPSPRQHDLLHRVQQIVDLFVVLENDVGVAADAESGRGGHFAVGKHRAQVRRDHVFHRRHVRFRLRRQRHPSRQLARHRHDDDPAVGQFGGAIPHEQTRHVQLQIRQQRAGLQFLNGQRR